jgi:DNA (cytosine-5)-methyltransferase 1
MPDNLTSGTLNKAGRIVRKSGNDYGINLADWVRLWPTPTSISPAKNGYNESGNSCGLVAIRKRISDEDSQATGQLNPTWVEWLMGFPLGWTDLEDSETP